MSTWHQDQALRRARAAGALHNPYQHPTKWTVVDDKIGALTTVERMDSSAEAHARAEKLPYAYVLPPRDGGMGRGSELPKSVSHH